MITADSLPDDIATLKALVLAGQAALADAEIARLTAESKARNLEAEVRARTLLIEQMKPFMPSCAIDVPSSPARAKPPRRSTTASSAGKSSPASSTTAGCACPTMPPNVRCASLRCLSHCAFLLQVSVNIGIVSVSSTRHGRPSRAAADLTDSDAKSSARIWYGAPDTTCTAGSTPDLIRRRIT